MDICIIIESIKHVCRVQAIKCFVLQCVHLFHSTSSVGQENTCIDPSELVGLNSPLLLRYGAEKVVNSIASRNCCSTEYFP